MPRSLPADIAEYSSIAPRLVEAGFTVLAIDPRSGDGAFGGTHRTVAGPGQSTAYEQAEAALAWARFDRLLPTMLELRPTCEHCATRSRLTPSSSACWRAATREMPTACRAGARARVRPGHR